MWRNLRSESGFTLIELLGVALILVILALLAIPVYADVADQAREGRTYEEMRVIGDQLEVYYAEHAYYPARLSDLVTGGYLKGTKFETGWGGRPYFYVHTSEVVNGKTRASYVLGVPGPSTACDNNACNPYGVAPHNVTPVGLLYERTGR